MAYVTRENDNDPIPDPLFVSVSVTPPAEIATLLMTTNGERFPAVAAAPYDLTSGSVWFAYTRQVPGGRTAAIAFQLPPP